jgi:hypothetical protein
MSNLHIRSLIALCFVSSLVGVRATETSSVAYVISLADEDGAGFVPASCLRASKSIEADNGFAALPGDVITAGTGKTLVAFVDGSCATLSPKSSLKIDAYQYPAQRCPTTVSVESGRAFFSVTPRPDDAHFMVHMRDHTIEVKGTQFDVITEWNSTTNTYSATVGVVKGSVTLNPSGATAVNMVVGTQVVLTSPITNITGYTGASTTLQQGNISTAEIKTLEASGVSTTEVNVGNNGSVSIKATSKNADGSVTTTSLTEVNGVTTKLSSSTKSGKTTTEKISESGTKETITQNSNGLQITEKLVSGAGTVTIKDSATKTTYTGTVTSITGGSLATATSKSGAKVVVETQYLANGTQQVTTLNLASGATSGSATVTIINPNGSTTTETQQVTSSSSGLTPVGAPTNVATTTPSQPQVPSVSTPGTPNPTNPLNPVPISQ